MDETVILVDEKDKFLGYAPRVECHTGKGRRHRAFVTLLFNSKGQVLLQKRKHKLFDGLWDLTAISHPLHVVKGNKSLEGFKSNKGRDESYQEASDRALLKEMGTSHVTVRKVGAFNYFARDGKNCENEYCAVLIGDFNGKFKISKDEVYEAKWVQFEDFITDIAKNPKNYTVWAKEASTILVEARGVNFWADLEKFKKSFSPYLKNYFTKRKSFARNYPKLVQRYYLESEDFMEGGKGLRPYLVWLGYRLGESQIVKVPPGGRAGKVKSESGKEKVLSVCLAVELVHNWFLIHDDIIDQSKTRRKKPTLHMRFAKDYGAYYGLSQAILTGDLLLLEAIKLLGDDVLVDNWIETIFGEGLDVWYEHEKANLDNIMQVIDLKTAKYSFVGPLLAGAKLGDLKDKAKLKALELFGLYCGRMYQLGDDVMGVFGDEAKMGKSVLTDMQEGKNTLLIYKTKELSSQKQRQRLDLLWGHESSGKREIAEIKQIIIESGAFAWYEEEILKHQEIILKQLPKITNNLLLVQIMRELVGSLVRRKG